MTTNSTRGRVWAYLGAILGGGISITANVAHSYVPPVDAAPDWEPQLGAVIGSVFWPVILFVAVEILARVVWPTGLWWGLLRFGGMIPVAGVAGLVSYRHLSSLLAFYGEDTVVTIAGPLAVDGLMVMATSALLVIGRRTAAVADAVPAVAVPASVAAQPVPVVPDAVPVPAERPVKPAGPVYSNVPAITGQGSDVRSWPSPALPAELLDRARAAADTHHERTGVAITRDELRTVLRVSNSTTGDVMRALGLSSRTVPAAINGHQVDAEPALF